MYIISFFHLHFLLIQDTLKFCHENTRTCQKVYWQPWPQPPPQHPFHLSFSIITAWVTTTILGLSVISQLWQYLIKTSRGWAVSSSGMELSTVLIAKLSSSWQLQLSPIWTEFCIISDNYHPPTPRIVVNRLPRKLKFGVEPLFYQTRLTSYLAATS